MCLVEGCFEAVSYCSAKSWFLASLDEDDVVILMFLDDVNCAVYASVVYDWYLERDSRRDPMVPDSLRVGMMMVKCGLSIAGTMESSACSYKI